MTINKEVFPHPMSVHNYLLRIRGGGSPLYLESGVLDLLQRAPLNIESYRPAQLYFDSELQSYASTSSAFMGEIKIDESLNITYEPKLDEGRSETGVGYKQEDMSTSIVATSGLTSQTFTSSEADLRESAQNRKEAQFWFPSSAFGGKMRLYVQSIYGSKRTDYSYDEPLIGTNYFGTLNIDGRGYSPYLGIFSYWIYTTDDYEYFLLRMTGGSITATKMEPSDKGKSLRRWLLENTPGAEETRRVEGYILSTTTLGDAYTIAVSSDTSPANDHGDPAFYGWHFNMAGTEGQVVTLEQRDDEYYYATHMKMTVSLDTSRKDQDEFYWQDHSNWSVSTSIIEGPTKFVFQLASLMWRYDLVFGGMEKVAYLIPPDRPTVIDADVPVYLVYNYADDDWDIVRWKLVTGKTHVGRNVPTASDPNTIHSNAGCLYYTDTGTSTANEYGFYVDGSTKADAVAHSAANVTGNAVEVLVGEFVRCGTGPLSDVGYYRCYGGEADIGGNFNFTSQFTIPIGDLDSVVVGGQSSFDGTVRWVNGMTFGGTEWNAGSCEDGAPSGSPSIDWINPPHPFPNFSFKVHLIDIAVPAGEAEEGNVDAAATDVWVVYFNNGEDELIHTDAAISDNNGFSEVYMPACLKENPYADVIKKSGGFSEGPSDKGGWNTHFRQGPNEHEFNADTTPARGNVTGDYFLVNLDSGPDWITNSYSDIEEKTYISFVGHD